MSTCTAMIFEVMSFGDRPVNGDLPVSLRRDVELDKMNSNCYTTYVAVPGR